MLQKGNLFERENILNYFSENLDERCDVRGENCNNFLYVFKKQNS